jgi:hypothetical protein
MEELDRNILFRWFVGLGLDDPVWDPTTFTKNRDPAVGLRDLADGRILPGGAGAGWNGQITGAGENRD